MKSILHVLSGPTAAGKTTRAQQLARLKRGQVVSFDQMRGWHPAYSDAEIQLSIVRQASMLLRAGCEYVVVDACNLHDHDKVRWETVALIMDAAFIWEP